MITELMMVLRRGIPRSRSLFARSLLAEINDGLHDAARAYEEAGYTPGSAARRAVEDFGDPTAVVEDLTTEIMARSARLSALTLGMGYAAILVAWALADPFLSSTGAPGSQWAAASFSWLGTAAAIVMIATLFRLRAAARDLRPIRRLVRIVGVSALLCSALTLLASYVVQRWSWTDLTPLDAESAVHLGSAGTVAMICLVAIRSLALAHHRTQVHEGALD